MSKKIKVVLVSFVGSVIILCALFILTWNHLVYGWERLVLANNPTILFSCDDFSTEGNLTQALNSPSSKLEKLNEYLKSIEGYGWIDITEVGDRCPGKYQFEVCFVSDSQRVIIEGILQDQRIDGTPVFLRNV